MLEITSLADQPKALESLYRRNPKEFLEAFPRAYLDMPDSQLLQAWHQRLFFTEDNATISTAPKAKLLSMLWICLFASIFIKLPQIFAFWKKLTPSDESTLTYWFYPRYAALIVLSGIAAYFLYQNKPAQPHFVGVLGTIAMSAIFLAWLPSENVSDQVLLSFLHMPLFVWFLASFAFGGHQWKLPSKRIEFLQFNGELLIYTSVILLGGMVLTGLTFALFGLINVHIHEWYTQVVVVCGIVCAPIVATYLYDAILRTRLNISALIAKVFAPLFLITIAAYLVAIVIGHKSPYSDREFLITFNALLILVLALSVLTLAETGHTHANIAQRVTNIGLITVTLVINLVALSAIVYRLSSFGLSPNKIAVLGTNLLVFGHLGGILLGYIRLIRNKADYASLELWISRYLPLYAVWTAIVAFGFPLYFGIK